MPLISDKPLKRVCIRLWEDDYDAIQRLANEGSETSTNEIIRTIVHNYVLRMKDLERRKLDAIQPVNIQL